MLEKTRRVQALTSRISSKLDAPSEEKDVVERTAELCKADLATAMVIEMTELQGIMANTMPKSLAKTRWSLKASLSITCRATRMTACREALPACWWNR